MDNFARDLAAAVAGELAVRPWLISWFTPIVTLPINFPLARKIEIHPDLCPHHEMDLYFHNVVRNDLPSDGWTPVSLM